VIKSYISDIFDSKYAYIYIWYSQNYRCLYVGQTNGGTGVLGRANAHMQRDGTLRKRFNEAVGEHLENTNDWNLISAKLPLKKKYTTVESSFRLAVEYLVQIKLHGIRSELSPPFRIISTVTYTDYCSVNEVIKVSDKIVERFKEFYSG